MIATWEDYKDVTGDTTTSEGVAVSRLLRAQRRAEEYTGRLFDRMERTEALPIIDRKVWPSAYPVASVVLPTTATITADALSIDVGTSTGTAASLLDLLDSEEVAPVTYSDRPQLLVTYVGGFATGAAPISLVEAICEMAQRYSMPANTTGVPAGVTSVNVGAQSYSGPVLGGASSLPLAIRNTLDRFRHIRLKMAD